MKQQTKKQKPGLCVHNAQQHSVEVLLCITEPMAGMQQACHPAAAAPVCTNIYLRHTNASQCRRETGISCVLHLTET